jgi:membrane-bound lytic murein transglycosylase D
LFQGRLYDFMAGGLERGQRYLPMIRRIFREENVPLDLAYVPLVESAFKSNALSRARARGMWQFMPGTGAEHGLRQDWFIDERSDPEKATRAAAQYLKTLHRMFDGDWALALASYNAGPGRVQRAADRARTEDYWRLTSSTRYLPRETREYVPMIMAAIVIAKNPELYGFEVEASAPLSFEKVTVDQAIDLKYIAEWSGVSVDALRELNPELRRSTTPMASHELKVPVGTAPTIARQLASAEALFVKFPMHTVKRGETVTTIARRYRVSVAELRAANDLTSRSKLRVSQTLMIPQRPAAGLPTAVARATQTTTPPMAAPVTHRVQRGDTLYSIARRYDTTVASLKQANRLRSNTINVGDRLMIR